MRVVIKKRKVEAVFAPKRSGRRLHKEARKMRVSRRSKSNPQHKIF